MVVILDLVRIYLSVFIYYVFIYPWWPWDILGNPHRIEGS